MCRFLAYAGKPILMAELLTRPDISLIKQSYRARERAEPLNGDGFGVGWYMPEIDPTPCVVTSITPAWSSRNLHRLAEKIVTPRLFAHVRAASPGMLVSEPNCHPFQHGRYLWMHNGTMAEFHKVKRRLRASLRDDLYEFIQGTTDSEHVFAVFLNLLGDPAESYSPEDLRRAMVSTVRRLDAWSEEAGARGPSFYNFAVTDGRSVVATRYVSDEALEPLSLYYSSGARFECRDGACRMVRAEPEDRAVIVTSEPLTELREDWLKVPKNHAVVVTPGLDVRLSPV